jgi:hypothetical protein
MQHFLSNTYGKPYQHSKLQLLLVDVFKINSLYLCKSGTMWKDLFQPCWFS